MKGKMTAEVPVGDTVQRSSEVPVTRNGSNRGHADAASRDQLAAIREELELTRNDRDALHALNILAEQERDHATDRLSIAVARNVELTERNDDLAAKAAVLETVLRRVAPYAPVELREQLASHADRALQTTLRAEGSSRRPHGQAVRGEEPPARRPRMDDLER